MSVDSKELKQIHPAERHGDVTKMMFTLSFGLSVDFRDATGRKQRMKVALDDLIQVLNSLMEKMKKISAATPLCYLLLWQNMLSKLRKATLF